MYWLVRRRDYDYMEKAKRGCCNGYLELYAATLKGLRVYTMAMKDKDDNIFIFFLLINRNRGYIFKSLTRMGG